jgi:hypothetical protein
MAYDITDYDELQIYVTDGWREWYIPKFRIFMTVEGDFANIYWTDTEKGASGLTRLLSLDYNDVTFGYIAPSSAGEVVLQIESYIISAFGGGGGVQSVTGLDTDNTDPLNPVVQIAVDGVTITGDGTSGNPLVAATPSTPDLDAVLTAGNDGGANEITNIADGTAASSAATVGQLNLRSRILDTQMNLLFSTNTSAETVVYAYQIPANTLAVGDMIEVHLYGRRASGSGTHTMRVYLNSSNVVGGAGATQYGGQTSTNNTMFAPRIFINGASSQVGFPNTASILWTQSAGSTFGTGTLSTASGIWVQITVAKSVGTDVYEIVAGATIIHKKA